MDRRTLGLIGAVSILLTTRLGAQKSGVATTPISPDYIVALGTANRFLAIWQGGDQHAGLTLMSARLKHSRPESELLFYLRGPSSPHHEAFEIGHGRRLPDGRYAFDVRLYDYLPHSDENQPVSRLERIVLSRAAPETWRVDALPADRAPHMLVRSSRAPWRSVR